MFPGSFRLGRFFGIDLNLHWSVAVIALVLGAGLAPALGWVAAVAGIFAFTFSIVAHEYGHALVARHYGVGTQSIELWALGGMARLDRESPSPRADGWIAAAGPLTSVVLGAAGIGGYLSLAAAGIDNVATQLIGWIGFINVALAVFNLLPGAPLDGGRIVRAVRWKMTGDRYRAMRDAAKAGNVLGWLMILGGAWMILNGLGGIWLIVVGVFITFNAKAEHMSSYVSERLDGIKVRDLTWFGVAAAGEDMDADSMLWERRRLGAAGAVAVQDAEGHLDGLVLEDELWAIPAERRPWVMLTQMMVPFNRLAQAGPDEDLNAVLPRLNPAKPVVTVWQDGRLLGVVPPARLREHLQARPG